MSMEPLRGHVDRRIVFQCFCVHLQNFCALKFLGERKCFAQECKVPHGSGEDFQENPKVLKYKFIPLTSY